nr:MAG TPA: hypothetical protein [Caudoviricetes sp.]
MHSKCPTIFHSNTYLPQAARVSSLPTLGIARSHDNPTTQRTKTN